MDQVQRQLDALSQTTWGDMFYYDKYDITIKIIVNILKLSKTNNAKKQSKAE